MIQSKSHKTRRKTEIPALSDRNPYDLSFSNSLFRLLSTEMKLAANAFESRQGTVLLFFLKLKMDAASFS